MARPNGTCEECGEQVLVAITAAGRRQLLNPEPDPRGNTAVYRAATGGWRSRVPNDDLPLLPWERMHMPHQATCDRSLAQPAPTPLLRPSVAGQGALRGWNGQLVRPLPGNHRRRRGNRNR
jgi:hypothetical protein